MSSDTAPGAGSGPDVPTGSPAGGANLGPGGPPDPADPGPGDPPRPFLMLDFAWPAVFPELDGAQLQAISAGVAGALSPTFGSTLDARAAFGPGVPLRFLRVAVWSDRVLAGSPDDASRKTAVETLRLRDTAAESFLIGASIDASAVRAIARTAFASFPRFYKFTGTDPATHDNADVEMRSLNLLIDSLPEDVPFTAGNEVVVFTARFELCHPKIPGTSLTIDLTDRVWATGGQALGTRTMISDVAASFWDNPLLWFATQILKLLAQSGIVSTFLSERGGFGTQFARILPPDLPILGTRRKFVFDYRNSRLESNAIVLRADYEVTDRTPALTVEGPTEVTRILLRADRDPARTTALTAAYRATTLDFTPTRYQWVLLGGPARIVLGPDAPQFDPVFIVPRTWGFGTFFIGCAASDDAGNQASGYLFVDAGLLSPPPHLPRPPIPQKQE